LSHCRIGFVNGPMKKWLNLKDLQEAEALLEKLQ